MNVSARRPVLVVEDDPEVREALEEIIADSGMPVVTARDGLDAKEQLEAGARPCMVLLDLMMPRMTGEEFLRWIRGSHEELRALPVVVLSANVQAPVPGANQTVTKPLHREQLLDLVTQHCG